MVDDLLAAGIGDKAHNLLTQFNHQFKLGSLKIGPGRFRFFGTNVIQNEDLSVIKNADVKLEGIFEYSVSRLRRKSQDSSLNMIEKRAYMSTNSSLGWIGTAASPICPFYTSHLQQKAPEIKVKHLIEQNNILKKLKKYGTTIAYPRPPLNVELPLSIVVFDDASRSDENGQIGIIAGLVVGDVREGSTFHTLLWLSHKSKRALKSVPLAEILAAAEGIDEGKAISAVYCELLETDVKLRIFVDSKDLFTSMSTQRVSVDRSIRGDVSSNRFEFQTGTVSEISWVPGKLNISDVLTKTDSSLTETLLLIITTGFLFIDFQSVIESKQSERNLR